MRPNTWWILLIAVMAFDPVDWVQIYLDCFMFNTVFPRKSYPEPERNYGPLKKSYQLKIMNIRLVGVYLKTENFHDRLLLSPFITIIIIVIVIIIIIIIIIIMMIMITRHPELKIVIIIYRVPSKRYDIWDIWDTKNAVESDTSTCFGAPFMGGISTGKST